MGRGSGGGGRGGGRSLAMGAQVTIPSGTNVGAGSLRESARGTVTGRDTNDQGETFYRVSFTDKRGRSRTTYYNPKRGWAR
jgi:hypothetical protein